MQLSRHWVTTMVQLYRLLAAVSCATLSSLAHHQWRNCYHLGVTVSCATLSLWVTISGATLIIYRL